MKIKLTHTELIAACSVIGQLFQKTLDRAEQSGKDAPLSYADLANRLVVMQLHELGEHHNKYIRPILHTNKVCMKFNACTGLALLAAWYGTDSAELNMTPLHYATMNTIADQLQKIYGGPIIAPR